MPLWALAALLLVIVWSYTVGGTLIARRWVLSWPRSENETVGYMLSIAGVAYAVLLAMIAVGAWNGSSSVDVAVQQEANALAGVYRGVAGYQPAARAHFQDLVRDYVDFAVRDEWPALSRDARSPRTELASQTLDQELIAYVPTTPNETLLKPIIVGKLNEFEDARRLRVLTGTKGLDAVTWLVVVLGGMVTIGFTFFFRTEMFRAQLLLSMLASGMIAVVIFLIPAMDHPLWGEVSVQPDALREVLHAVSAPPSSVTDSTQAKILR